MSKIPFFPQEWTAPSKEKAPIGLAAPIYNKVDGSSDDVERIVSEIEQRRIDIAPSYDEWYKLGFALADGLGENGRSYYHRLSRLHSDYDQKKTDKQYAACLSSHGNGITIGTFFHQAKEAGVDIGVNNHFSEKKKDGDLEIWRFGGNGNINPGASSVGNLNAKFENTEELPMIPDEVYEHLPSFLKRCVDNASSIEDRDTILLGTLACISACFHNVRGVYDGKIVYSNLYLFVTADAGMGKGALTLCRYIVDPIDQELHEISKRQMDDYKELLASSRKGEKVELPEEPRRRMLLIPANSSASSFLKLLSDNYGQGLMFETEGDTLSQAFNSDYGNFSDVIRKASHHEKVSLSRRKDGEFIDISDPCLSAVLAGTPEQVRRLIHDAENGLLSRFCFYKIPFRRNIRNVFAISDISLAKNTIYRQLGEQFKHLHEYFTRRGEFVFTVPKFLHDTFNDWLIMKNEESCDEIDNGMQGVIRRVGLGAFRIMMLLAIVREFENPAPYTPSVPGGTIPLICTDEDFHTAISIANVLIEHDKKVYCKLASPEKLREIKNMQKKVAVRRNRLFNIMPDKFSREDYEKAVADTNEILSTAEKWLDVFIKEGRLKRVAHSQYEKV